MKDDEEAALKDFGKLTHDPNGDMQEFVNTHKSYCRTVAINAHVKCLYLLMDNYYDAPNDDKYRFLNQLYQNRDLMEENE